MSQSKLTQEQITELKKTFDQTDTNKDGFVSKEELKNMCKQQNWEQNDAFINELLNATDANEDGKIDFGEWCKAMTD